MEKNDATLLHDVVMSKQLLVGGVRGVYVE
jgi:hypothetical protein